MLQVSSNDLRLLLSIHLAHPSWTNLGCQVAFNCPDVHYHEQRDPGHSSAQPAITRKLLPASFEEMDRKSCSEPALTPANYREG